MPVRKTTVKTKKPVVKVTRPVAKTQPTQAKEQPFFDRVQNDLRDNQSFLNLILGTLVVLVIGVLLFNFFTKRGANNNTANNLGPASQTQSTEAQQAAADVAKNSLPGKYTVKQGDTLYLISQKYYDDGFKYNQIVKANNLSDENAISVGQQLTIPKLDQAQAQASPTTSPSEVAQATPTPEASQVAQATPTPLPTGNAPNPQNLGTGGATNETIWGERITGTTYTVQQGDWLSKIAGRAYGDIMQYQKIAQANNISDPNLIEPGTVLKIPR